MIGRLIRNMQTLDSNNTVGQTPDASLPDTEHSLPLTQKIADRLNAKLQQSASVGEQNLPGQLLEILGHHLHQWRLRNGHNRQQMAQKLNWEADLLLCLEHGIGWTTDLTESQLSALCALLTQSEADDGLREAVRRYRASLN
jgi:hypothetical protein